MIMTIPIYAIPKKRDKIPVKEKRKPRGICPEIEFQTLLDTETKKLEMGR